MDTLGTRVTSEQLREGEEGLRRLLFAKRFSREWIERHVPEVMAQARSDLANRMAVEQVNDAVALLVVIAYRRALKVLRAESTKPKSVSLENVFELADRSARTPEQEVIDGERQKRLLEAMSHLSEREQKLLALHYFGELTVKDAGRQLGWSPSSAVRHQRAALEKLQALVGDRALLSGEIGVPAVVASDYTLPKGQLGIWLDAASNCIREVVTFGAHRYAPVAEAGNAMAMSGAGRTTAGVCGLAVAVCLGAVTSGVVGPGVGIGDSYRRAEQDQPKRGEASRPRSAKLLPGASQAPLALSPPSIAEAEKGQQPAGQKASAGNRRFNRSLATRSRQSQRARAAQSTPQQTVAEFGVESGQSEALREPAPEDAGGAAPASPATPAPLGSSPPPSPSPPAGGGSGRSEFGM